MTNSKYENVNRQIDKLSKKSQRWKFFTILSFVIACCLIITDIVLFGFNFDIFHIPESRLEILLMKESWVFIFLTLVCTVNCLRRKLDITLLTLTLVYDDLKK